MDLQGVQVGVQVLIDGFPVASNLVFSDTLKVEHAGGLRTRTTVRTPTFGVGGNSPVPKWTDDATAVTFSVDRSQESKDHTILWQMKDKHGPVMNGDGNPTPGQAKRRVRSSSLRDQD